MSKAFDYVQQGMNFFFMRKKVNETLGKCVKYRTSVTSLKEEIKNETMQVGLIGGSSDRHCKYWKYKLEQSD